MSGTSATPQSGPIPENLGVHTADMAPLIRRVREYLEIHKEASISYEIPDDLIRFAHQVGLAPRKKGRSEVILADDVAVELGHPSVPSRSIVLFTFSRQAIRHGRISLVGADVDRLSRDSHHPFAQVVMLAIRHGAEPDPFEIESTQYLTHRLPGYMVRSVPGRLWVRISKKALAAGLTLQRIGSALVAAYTSDFDYIEGVEIVFVTSSAHAVEELAPTAAEATILSGRHKKLVLGVDGEVECPELNCESCDEKPVCDSLRDIVIKRRKRIQ